MLKTLAIAGVVENKTIAETAVGMTLLTEQVLARHPGRHVRRKEEGETRPWRSLSLCKHIIRLPRLPKPPSSLSLSQQTVFSHFQEGMSMGRPA